MDIISKSFGIYIICNFIWYKKDWIYLLFDLINEKEEQYDLPGLLIRAIDKSLIKQKPQEVLGE